jgi:hypothetical protein
MEEGGGRFPTRAGAESFSLPPPRRPREGCPDFGSGGGKKWNVGLAPLSGVGWSPVTLPVEEARRKNSTPRIATWAMADILCAEPYRVEVLTLEKKAGAPFAE